MLSSALFGHNVAMKNSQRVVVTITNRTIARFIIWIMGVIVLFHFFDRVGHVLTLIFAAFFLALALNPVVGFLSRRLKIESRARATAAAYILVIAVIIGFFAVVTPPLVRQTRDFVKEVPQLVDNFQTGDSGLAKQARRYHLDQKISTSAKEFANNYGNFGGTVLNTGKRIIGIVASILAVLVMTFMMLVEGPYWMNIVWGITPEKDRARYKKMATEMYKGVSGFVNGQVIVSLLAGLFAFAALEVSSHIAGVSINAVALAGIVAVFGLIPLFGNPISSAIVILFCLLNSTSVAIIMLCYFVVYFFVESHTFQPYIQSRLNRLTALSVFIAAILGIAFAGFMGAIVAIPIASSIKVVLEDYFERKAGHKLVSPGAGHLV